MGLRNKKKMSLTKTWMCNGKEGLRFLHAFACFRVAFQTQRWNPFRCTFQKGHAFVGTCEPENNKSWGAANDTPPLDIFGEVDQSSSMT